jgi:hypothetical protein
VPLPERVKVQHDLEPLPGICARRIAVNHLVGAARRVVEAAGLSGDP